MEQVISTRFYFLLQNLSRSCYQLLTPGNLQSVLTEGNRCHLPVAPCQSKQLISLYVLLDDKQSFCCCHSCLLASTMLNWSFISLTDPDSSIFYRLFVSSVLRLNCSQTNLIIHWVQSMNTCKTTLISKKKRDF